jgi:hypothetical protein
MAKRTLQATACTDVSWNLPFATACLSTTPDNKAHLPAGACCTVIPSLYPAHLRHGCFLWSLPHCHCYTHRATGTLAAENCTGCTTLVSSCERLQYGDVSRLPRWVFVTVPRRLFCLRYVYRYYCHERAVSASAVTYYHAFVPVMNGCLPLFWLRYRADVRTNLRRCLFRLEGSVPARTWLR